MNALVISQCARAEKLGNQEMALRRILISPELGFSDHSPGFDPKDVSEEYEVLLIQSPLIFVHSLE